MIRLDAHFAFTVSPSGRFLVYRVQAALKDPELFGCIDLRAGTKYVSSEEVTRGKRLILFHPNAWVQDVFTVETFVGALVWNVATAGPLTHHPDPMDGATCSDCVPRETLDRIEDGIGRNDDVFPNQVSAPKNVEGTVYYAGGFRRADEDIAAIYSFDGETSRRVASVKSLLRVTVSNVRARPDGRLVAFVTGGSSFGPFPLPSRSKIWVWDSVDDKVTLLGSMDMAVNIMWDPDGSVLFVSGIGPDAGRGVWAFPAE